MNTIGEFSWLAWEWHPDIFIGLLLLEAAYVYGVGPLRRRYGWADRVEAKHLVLFTLGVLTLFIALVSPLHDLGDAYLFSAHMTQHMLMILVAAPLLLMGTPDWLLRPLLSHDIVMKGGTFLRKPLVAFVIFNGTLALWHLPTLYGLALHNHGVHIVQHLSFIFTGLLVWWPILSPLRELPRLNYPLQMLYLFLLSFLPAVVGALITFTGSVIYLWYDQAPRVYDISPLVDQQMAGLLMKTLGTIVYISFLITVFFKWYNQEEEEARAERLLREWTG